MSVRAGESEPVVPGSSAAGLAFPTAFFIARARELADGGLLGSAAIGATAGSLRGAATGSRIGACAATGGCLATPWADSGVAAGRLSIWIARVGSVAFGTGPPDGRP